MTLEVNSLLIMHDAIIGLVCFLFKKNEVGIGNALPTLFYATDQHILIFIKIS